MHAVRDRLKQLLILILETLTVEEFPAARELRLRDALDAAGFDAEDVVGLLAWFDDQSRGEASDSWLTARSVQLPASRTIRLQTDEERRYLSPEAFGYLLRLRGDDQITWQQLETVVQVASLAGEHPLTREDLGEILDHVLLTVRPAEIQPPAPGSGAQAH